MSGGVDELCEILAQGDGIQHNMPSDKQVIVLMVLLTIMAVQL